MRRGDYSKQCVCVTVSVSVSVCVVCVSNVHTRLDRVGQVILYLMHSVHLIHTP